ncbi:MAG: tRNA guanosine(34) transglycosylase Tgt [Planctomycetota bacterium]|jgi:queuine tRNA-ribosyltransferase
MSTPLRFSILARCRSSPARLGRIETPHGSFETPAFIPVGSRGSVKGLTPQQLQATGTRIVLANAFHLMLRPGAELIARAGGLHRFMAWDAPVLTDSGGYQAYSMADINRVDDDGVTFRSIIDGALVRLSPERSIEVQNALGADIIMAFDDCPPAGGAAGPDDGGRRTTALAHEPGTATPGPDRFRVAHERTLRWLERCRAAHRRPAEQALFGIVQGGTDLGLRRASVEGVCNVELPGYAIGGVAVGEAPELIHLVVEFTAPLLPADRPRYLMGVGYERDLVAAVRAGVDLFDCVLPTRNGRNANAFTRDGPLRLRNARFGTDEAVVEPGCDCTACRGGFSRAYLRYLFQAGEMLGPILVSIHNIRHFQRLMLDIHRAIREDSWSGLAGSWPVLESGARPGTGAATPSDRR